MTDDATGWQVGVAAVIYITTGVLVPKEFQVVVSVVARLTKVCSYTLSVQAHAHSHCFVFHTGTPVLAAIAGCPAVPALLSSALSILSAAVFHMGHLC